MGLHLILDYECYDKRMNYKAYIRNFLNSLVSIIKMKKLAEPLIKEGKRFLPGISGIIIITTSHISIHTFTKQNRINIDIYSCRDFNEIDVIEHLNRNFSNLKLLNKQIIERDDGQIITPLIQNVP